MKNFEEVPSGEELGRMAYHLPPDEQKTFRDTVIAKAKAAIEQNKAKIILNLRVLEEKAKEILEQLGGMGSFLEGKVESIFRWLFMGFWLLTSLAGEYVIWVWTLETFRLGRIETNLVASTIIASSLEGLHHFLTYSRKQFPSLDNQLFLVLGCLIWVSIFLLIFVAADIRGNLWHMTSTASLLSSPEQILKNVEEFYGKSSRNFTFLMVILSSLVTLISSITYHDLRGRFFHGLRYGYLLKELKQVGVETGILNEEMIRQDSLLQKFISDFDVGFAKEKIQQSQSIKENLVPTAPTQARRTNMENRKNLVPAFLPILLIILAILLFIAIKTARGDTVIAFDLSISSGAVDYSGRDTEFEKNVRGVEDYIKTNTSPNQNVKVIGITEDSFGRRYILVDGEISKDKGVFGENLARDRLSLLNQFKKHDLKPNAKMTDLFGAMQLAEVLFSSSKTENRLIVFSDMRHFGPGIDFETPRVIDVNSTLKEVMQKRLVANLTGVKVWCLGVHSVGKTPAYWKSLRDFWNRYFQEAKVSELKAFTMERRIQNE